MLILPRIFGNFSPHSLWKFIVSNKKASLIAIIVVVIVFMIYDRFKPLSEEKLISKRGIATVYLDNSYKNIDSTNAPEGTLLAQYSPRHKLSVLINGGHLTQDEAALSLEAYVDLLVKDAPTNSQLTILNIDRENQEVYYTLVVPEALYSWQRLKLEGDTMTVISAVSETAEPRLDPMKILTEAQFGSH